MCEGRCVAKGGRGGGGGGGGGGGSGGGEGGMQNNKEELHRKLWGKMMLLFYEISGKNRGHMLPRKNASMVAPNCFLDLLDMAGISPDNKGFARF